MILNTDSYKYSHKKQFPANSEYINYYIEARDTTANIVFFGLQAFIKEYLLKPITIDQINEAEEIVTAHGLTFYREDWELIVKEYGGYLPISISAVPEGTVVPGGNVLLQVINTDKRFFWLPGFIETAMLRAIWYPSTVATISREVKKNILQALRESSDRAESQIDFKLHDFGARGSTSREASMLGGMAHLVNFKGTDTISAIVGARSYYNEPMAGFSIPASEHSTIITWGKDAEADAYKNMINQFGKPGSMFACVSDSYDINHATDVIWGKQLKQKVIDSAATLVVRPDSGNPTTVPITTVKQLIYNFGYYINNKGFKVLPDNIRVIQGDGLTPETIKILLKNMLDAKLSIDNIAFGMGAGLLQNVNRGTFNFAMKASAIISDNRVTEIYKNPVSGDKKSKAGLLKLVNVVGCHYSGFKTVKHDEEGKNLLQEVYRNGLTFNETSFSDIRKRAKVW